MELGNLISNLFHTKPEEIGTIDVNDEVPDVTCLSTNLYDVNTPGFVTEAVHSNIPVIVEFHTQWCAPCNHMVPIFKKLASEYGGMVKFIKVDLDKSPLIVSHFNITGVPTIMFIKNGMVLRTMVGYTVEKKIRQSVDKMLKNEI